MDDISDRASPVSGSSGSDFRRVVAAFMDVPGLPFASVLSAKRIERIFSKHRNLFAMDGV